MNGGAQRELLITPALPGASNRTNRFTSGQQAYGLSAMFVAKRGNALDVSQHHRLDVPLDLIFGDLGHTAEIRFGDPLSFDERLAIVQQQMMRAPATVFGVRSRKIWQSAAGYKDRDVSGEFVEQVVSLDDPVEIGPRGQTLQRRPRGDGR